MNVMMDKMKDVVFTQLGEIARTESGSIKTATSLICDAIQDDVMVHVLGTGAHSAMAAEEVLWRAGGLAAWNPIIDPGTSLIHGARKSISFERLPGYGVGVLDAYGVGQNKKEVMIIINAYGIDQMCLDVAFECQNRGVKTIGITSKEYARAVSLDDPVRHNSRKNLFEVVDVCIDSHVPYGDAAVNVEGLESKVGSVSTFCNCFIMNSLVANIAQELVRRGIDPPVFVSANVPGGLEANVKWEKKYGHRVRHLL